MDKKVTTLRPYDQHGENFTISCTLDSKIISAESFSCGTYDRDAANVHGRRVLHSDALHHILIKLLPEIFFFTTPSQTATSSTCPLEAACL